MYIFFPSLQKKNKFQLSLPLNHHIIPICFPTSVAPPACCRPQAQRPELHLRLGPDEAADGEPHPAGQAVVRRRTADAAAVGRRDRDHRRQPRQGEDAARHRESDAGDTGEEWEEPTTLLPAVPTGACRD